MLYIGYYIQYIVYYILQWCCIEYDQSTEQTYQAITRLYTISLQYNPLVLGLGYVKLISSALQSSHIDGTSAFLTAELTDRFVCALRELTREPCVLAHALWNIISSHLGTNGALIQQAGRRVWRGAALHAHSKQKLRFPGPCFSAPHTNNLFPR